jgi:hypothetical protein
LARYASGFASAAGGGRPERPRRDRLRRVGQGEQPVAELEQPVRAEEAREEGALQPPGARYNHQSYYYTRRVGFGAPLSACRETRSGAPNCRCTGLGVTALQRSRRTILPRPQVPSPKKTRPLGAMRAKRPGLQRPSAGMSRRPAKLGDQGQQAAKTQEVRAQQEREGLAMWRPLGNRDQPRSMGECAGITPADLARSRPRGRRARAGPWAASTERRLSVRVLYNV